MRSLLGMREGDRCLGCERKGRSLFGGYWECDRFWGCGKDDRFWSVTRSDRFWDVGRAIAVWDVRGDRGLGM